MHVFLHIHCWTAAVHQSTLHQPQSVDTAGWNYVMLIAVRWLIPPAWSLKAPFSQEVYYTACVSCGLVGSVYFKWQSHNGWAHTTLIMKDDKNKFKPKRRKLALISNAHLCVTQLPPWLTVTWLWCAQLWDHLNVIWRLVWCICHPITASALHSSRSEMPSEQSRSQFLLPQRISVFQVGSCDVSSLLSQEALMRCWLEMSGMTHEW